jgi:hypothetical protein
MSKIDVNRLLALMALIAIIVIAAVSGYRLEIGTSGLRFEPNTKVDLLTGDAKAD